MRKLLLFFTLSFCTLFAISDDNKDMIIKNAWARAAELDKSTAVYMEIINNTKKDFEIIGVESNVAKMTMLHKTVIENGISQMVHIDRLVIPAQKTVELSPKGLHIMLVGLNKTLNPDDHVEVTLSVKDEKPKTVKAVVKNQLSSNE